MNFLPNEHTEIKNHDSERKKIAILRKTSRFPDIFKSHILKSRNFTFSKTTFFFSLLLGILTSIVIENVQKLCKARIPGEHITNGQKMSRLFFVTIPDVFFYVRWE